MLLLAMVLFAQEGAAKEQPRGGLGLDFLIPIGISLALLWLLVLRPQRRWQEQQEKEKRESMKKGDQVLTHGGIKGQIVSVSETDDEVVVKVDDACRLKMIKAAIIHNYTHDERVKAAKEKKDPPKAEGQVGPAESIRKA